MTSPRTVLPPPLPEIVNPFTFVPALAPFSSMIGAPAKPGWEVPSRITGTVIAGSAESGLIVCTPEPGMLKSIVWTPEAALTLRIACRNEPGPELFVIWTTNGASSNLCSTRSPSNDRRRVRRDPGRLVLLMVQSQHKGPVRGRRGLVLGSGSTGELNTIQLAMEIERSTRSRRNAPTPGSRSAPRGRLSGPDTG